MAISRSTTRLIPFAYKIGTYSTYVAFYRALMDCSLAANLRPRSWSHCVRYPTQMRRISCTMTSLRICGNCNRSFKHCKLLWKLAHITINTLYAGRPLHIMQIHDKNVNNGGVQHPHLCTSGISNNFWESGHKSFLSCRIKATISLSWLLKIIFLHMQNSLNHVLILNSAPKVCEDSQLRAIDSCLDDWVLCSTARMANSDNVYIFIYFSSKSLRCGQYVCRVPISIFTLSSIRLSLAPLRGILFSGKRSACLTGSNLDGK